jgi:hypothetical protein
VGYNFCLTDGHKSPVIQPLLKAFYKSGGNIQMEAMRVTFPTFVDLMKILGAKMETSQH